MATYLLRLNCIDTNSGKETEANACVIAETLDEAERHARELIASHSHHSSELIAYSQVRDEEIAALDQIDAMLYLKAQNDKQHRAVIFS